MEEQNNFSELYDKLNQLILKQNEMSKEIVQLRDLLKAAQLNEQSLPIVSEKAPVAEVKDKYVSPSAYEEYTAKNQVNNPPKKSYNFEIKSELEKFIGENLINKIGIIILVIGVAIGAKYSIDHNLINPLTRIILGYLSGAVLLGFGFKLKAKYESFSAVLVSGAMAIFYFITFFAYNFYSLIPQLLAFVLMVVFTIFTVISALQYNKQVIALIGLVGAYAVPLLLSDGSGKVLIFFAYIAIVNAGLMVIAIKKEWKPLYYAAFGLTWLVFANWLFTTFNVDEHFVIALVFATLFFIEFYITFLAYKLAANTQFSIEDVVLILVNSFLYFGLGLYIIGNKTAGQDYFGLFTVINATLHFIVSYIIYSKKLADKNLFYLIAGLVLVFITIAIPIQLDGNWVTLLWIGETALLFWIGRSKNQSIYETLSFVLLPIAILSLAMDWSEAYYSLAYRDTTNFTSLLNIHFVSALLFVGALAFMLWVRQTYKSTSLKYSNQLIGLFSSSLPFAFAIGLFFLFYNEIGHYWDLRMVESKIVHTVKEGDYSYNNSLIHPSFDSFKAVWLVNYFLFFVSILAFISKKINLTIKNNKVLFFTIIGALLVYLNLGLYEISELRENYLNQENSVFEFGNMHLYIRYISYLFVGCTLLALFKLKTKEIAIIFDITLLSLLVWVASSELLHFMDLQGRHDSYKLALSILWGCFSLAIVALGIWKNKKHLRVGAIALFAATLLKLFLYDITHLSTISKTIVFVSLGVLLLLISFLYNKNKHRIFDEN